MKFKDIKTGDTFTDHGFTMKKTNRTNAKVKAIPKTKEYAHTVSYEILANAYLNDREVYYGEEYEAEVN